ncbi:glycerophosphodiester phosphodiesterase [Subsaxibacter sp. CAU 1640]|uniref:glycerophosphodiester phosphodiesterase n=1 Tax=Subsaxibacter sp. CAU 1640 TaxID=2933271 RepID=UPI0020030011|nr:glycerophosphodiester phosphodiesterase family protein [Subsaxibacter sp. CAU 1640]MCK7589035.1 glycerophosphodiester phosphodiesterase [Subsaxibacter sp. CAU 1640]
MLKIGHRGAAGYVAENTLESIDKALELGVDGVEIDVHLCASGELVVHHDLTLDRMTNGSGEIATWTLKELKYLLVGDRYRIPTLVEVLDHLNARCLLNIELKGEDTAKPTVELLQQYIKDEKYQYENILLSSFHFKELEIVSDLDPNFQLAVLTIKSIDEAILIAEKVNAKYLHPHTSVTSKVGVKAAHYYGYKVNAWTANMKDTIKKMKLYRVDGLISDKPDRL